jgi:hypothetical protein
MAKLNDRVSWISCSICPVFLCNSVHTVARMRRLIYNGYWIENWIYWITHSYTQLECIHSYSSLQFTTALAESSHRIFTGCLSSNIAGSVRLQLCNSSLKTAARPEYLLVTANSVLVTRELVTNCPRNSLTTTQL